MQMRAGTLAALPELEERTDEQLKSESKHRAAARTILGARAAERYDSQTSRRYFNEALAACTPQERPYLRQMMKASLAQAERRPEELKEAMEKLGQAPPTGRQMLALRLMGLVSPPPGASVAARARGIAILLGIVVVLLAAGYGLAELGALPFGGIGLLGGSLVGVAIVIGVLGVLVLLGRRRQARQREAARAGPRPG
ncbi:MAG: hypothetical protein H0U12_05830 [Thermoleophilaceae bacterium]|nr:hypothetical protein [Thermoleophilaceae bacterium]